MPPPAEPMRLRLGGSLFFTRPAIGDYQSSAQELDESAAALFEVILSGQVKIEIGQTFALADAGRAHAALASRETIGASLLIP